MKKMSCDQNFFSFVMNKSRAFQPQSLWIIRKSMLLRNGEFPTNENFTEFAQPRIARRSIVCAEHGIRAAMANGKIDFQFFASVGKLFVRSVDCSCTTRCVCVLINFFAIIIFMILFLRSLYALHLRQ